MGVPVAILMIPSALAGYIVIGGRWNSLLAADFAVTPASSLATFVPEWLSTILVLAFVAVGTVVAYVRYGSFDATASAVERLRSESMRMPQLLVRAFYFDEAYDVLLLRPARAIGSAFMSVVDSRVIDGAVR